MKTRIGFVSNSSSSSFCIYGLHLDDIEDVKKIYKKLTGKKYKNKSDEDDEVYEIADKLEEQVDFSIITDQEGGVYIGKSWSSIGDHETGKQFKKTIEEQLGEKCCTIEEIISC